MVTIYYYTVADYLNSTEEAASMSEVGVKHTGASQMVGNFVVWLKASIKFDYM